MNAPNTPHSIRLVPPFYETGVRGSLHRYLDAEFIDRYRQDVQSRRFGLTQFGAWLEEERHSRHGQEPVLRLPLHRAFHVFACEAQCDRLGRPPLDPMRIASAGFVIRRVAGSREEAWVLEDGEPLGWQAAATEPRDPDLSRRLTASGILPRREARASFSGEETHPLHPLSCRDADGHGRTLLFGYLPLGGSYVYRTGAAPFDEDSARRTAEIQDQLLPWPFGYRQPLSRTWGTHERRPLARGRPSQALFELLKVLVHRYHLGEAGRAENAALETWTSGLWLFDEGQLPGDLPGESYSDANHHRFAPFRRGSFHGYLEACFQRGANNPLVPWLLKQDRAATGDRGQLSLLPALPRADGLGDFGLSLFLRDADAEELRSLLNQRWRDQTLAQAREIPLPKFTQGANDLYQIVPFVRTREDCGRERIHWAGRDCRSLPFRVAAPFDPEASRPSAIQMPSLADLKRGLAKGASLITPADTFDLVNRLRLAKGVSEDLVPEPDESSAPWGVQWICSFSLPVITLVAMILLMIMVTILNLVFFWLPWVRICLPFPKFNR